VLAASVVQELPFGVGGPAPDDPTQRAEVAPETLPSESEATEPSAPTATPLPPTPTATATSEPAVALPAPTNAPTEAPAVMSAGLAATLATDQPAPTPTPTWTAGVDEDGTDRNAERSGVQIASLAASETTLPTPTVTATQATTPVPTPTATPIIYQVRAGDTLVSIASAYGVDVEALMAANDMGEQDVYVLQQGQMLFVPVLAPEPVAAIANEVADARVEAPLLLVPTADARVGCATGGTLIWQRVQFVKDSDKYMLHLGFVSGRDSNGQESVTWVLAQSSPVTVTEWPLDTSLCELAPDEYDHQWRWWVEVAETVGGDTVSVSQPSEIRGFTWE
jgi:LysM repeat protein